MLAHLLPGAEYAVFAAGQTLMLLAGTAASACIPWALAKAVRAHPAGSTERREAMAFALVVSGVGSLLAIGVLGTVAALFAPLNAAFAIGISGAGVVLSGVAVGWMQGELRFTSLAVLRVVEVVLRVLVGVGAVTVGLGAAGALGGFLAGALALGLLGLTRPGSDGRRAWRDLAWIPRTLTETWRWAETGGLAVVQIGLAALTAIDIVMTPIVTGASPDAGSFQLAATLGRAPLFVATALAVVLFPQLPSVPAIRTAVRGFGWLALTAAVALLTLPPTVLGWIVPPHLLVAWHIMPAATIAGIGYGVVALLVTVLQGAGRFRQALLSLAAAAVLVAGGLVAGWHLAGIVGLSRGVAVASLLAAAGFVATTWRLLPRHFYSALIGPVLTVGAGGVVLLLVRNHPMAWVFVGALLGVLAFWRSKGGRHPTPRVHAVDPSGRLRVLQLGLEDPRRTHELTRRLAEQHDLTVLTPRYPGCVDGVVDGVRYVHVGLGSTRLRRVLTYATVLPFVARRYADRLDVDLVVEDVVVPTTSLERFAARVHRHVVTVSEVMAHRPHVRSPRAMGSGVDERAFASTPRQGEDVVYVGRLDLAQKGVDLLLRAYARVADRLSGALVIAGTGPDRAELERLADELGMADRVRFLGWVDGPAKFELLAGARVVAVPSRFEPFGTVAIEALAVGSVVVAFDLDRLRDVVPDDCGRRVPAFDVVAYGEALVDAATDPTWAQAIQRRRQFARQFSWGALAERQNRALRATVSR
ncbi:glycosyltransferase involved in cell wall biosynthesis/O-antigen/teichoic acid export membrane protein [Tenggerimyces flavus]|nr:glycosyltransferase involved in cell wall biosynthesis/O-antigen/teichoic acid export membrane protein [Tenggerimyces flavus]